MSTEQSSQSSRGIFSFLVVLLLFVIIGLQLWYMLDIKKQLDTIQGEYDNLQSIMNEITPTDNETASDSISDGSDRDAAEKITITSDESTTSLTHDETASAPEDVQHSHTQQSSPKKSSPKTQQPSRNINPYYPPFRAYPEPFSGQYPGPYTTGPNWDPYNDIRRMHQEMREEMEHAFRERPSNRPNTSPRQQSNFEYHFKEDFSAPKMRVREDERHYYVSLNIPGADENDVSVKLEGQHLTVIGKQKTQKQQSDPDGQFTFSHSSTGKFKRSIILREPVDESGLQTRVENGVLMIRIPKRVL